MTSTPASQPKPPVLGDWQPLPTAGATPHTPSDAPNPHFDKLIYGRSPSDWAIRIVLVLVMTAALAVGTWSIYNLLTHQLHAPKPVATLGCGLFDVAGLFFALLSQRYAVTTDSGLAPRLAMLAMVSTSSWVNWQHGKIEHWGTVGSVILAAAPIIAELAFEMFHRYAHRETLRRLGRVAQTLPIIGKWAWLAHPIQSGRTVDKHIRAGLTEHEAVAVRRGEVAKVRARALVQVPIVPTVELTRIAEPEQVQVREGSPVQVHDANQVPALPVHEQVREPQAAPEPAPANQVPRTGEPAAPEPARTPVREPATNLPAKVNRAANLPANLTDRATTKTNQIEEVLGLIEDLGYDTVKLGLVMEKTGMTKTTAYHRLNDARSEWHKRTTARTA